MEYLHSELTDTILKGFYAVCKALPCGLEIEVYRKALALELESLQLNVVEMKSFPIHYRQTIIGELSFDLLVNESVGLKLQNSLTDITDLELILNKKLRRLTPIEVMLILNFGIEGHHKRLFLGNEFKGNKN